MSRRLASTYARTTALALGILLAGTGCSTMGGEDPGPTASEGTTTSPDSTSGKVGGRVVLVSHESFNLPEKLVASFERESGIDLVTRTAGDAGTLTAKLSLTKDNPIADVAFGVDNTFASRPLEEGVFAAYEPDVPPPAEYALEEGSDRLTAIDHGSVCVNVDLDWFQEQGIEPPQTLEDLTDPAYRGLFVTPGASTSSPGMAFFLATVAAFGDSWRGYWTDLLANDAKVVDGWEDAYYGDFTAGSDKGARPIVVSYDSSPAFTVQDGRSTTAALLDTCFRQVEYAGVLEGAENPGGAQAVIDWMLTDRVQSQIPESMYVFPVSPSARIPEDWAKFAVQPRDPLEVPPAEIAAEREQWLAEWTDVVTR